MTATETPNLYTYVSNMVTRMVDPSGKTASLPVIIGIAVALTVAEIACIYPAWKSAVDMSEDGRDKLAHCYLACRIKQCLLKCHVIDFPMRIGMWLWETVGGGINDAGDIIAGEVGLLCGGRSGSCRSCCGKELKQRRIN